MKIAIIDYGMGNLRSVEKAFHKVGATGAFITSDPAEVSKADKAVLPGDGAFDSTMLRLNETGVTEAALDFAASGRPFLGICVGMQAFMTQSEEGRAGVIGLQLIPGQIRRFPKTESLKVPQIGWNQLSFPRESALFADIPDKSYVYFLHSYYCDADNTDAVTATCEYGLPYAAGLQKANVYATQFHPEKSGAVGMQILRNFAFLS